MPCKDIGRMMCHQRPKLEWWSDVASSWRTPGTDGHPEAGKREGFPIRSEGNWSLGIGDGQGGLACCDSWGRKESDMTERLNWIELSLKPKNTRDWRPPRSWKERRTPYRLRGKLVLSPLCFQTSIVQNWDSTVRPSVWDFVTTALGNKYSI